MMLIISPRFHPEDLEEFEPYHDHAVVGCFKCGSHIWIAAEHLLEAHKDAIHKRPDEPVSLVYKACGGEMVAENRRRFEGN